MTGVSSAETPVQTDTTLTSNLSMTPDVIHVLDELFMLCRIPFVTDFVFTSDAVADISMLTSPVQNEHAVAAHICVSAVDSAPTDSLSSFGYSDDFLFATVPAFSVGAISVGFCTVRHIKSMSHNSKGNDDGNESPDITTYLSSIAMEDAPCNRYVRDDGRGIFLVVSEKAAVDTIELDCMVHRSSRRRTRVRARFSATILRAALQSAYGVLQPNMTLPALSELSVAYERRECPLCGESSPLNECSCELPFRRPAHPLDFRYEHCNMSLYTGQYSGSTTLRLFTMSPVGVIPYAVSALGTRSVIKGNADRSVVSMLTRDVVQQRLASLSINPTALTVPSGQTTFLPIPLTDSFAKLSTPFPNTTNVTPSTPSVLNVVPPEPSQFTNNPATQQGDVLDSLLAGLEDGVSDSAVNTVTPAMEQNTIFTCEPSDSPIPALDIDPDPLSFDPGLSNSTDDSSNKTEMAVAVTDATDEKDRRGDSSVALTTGGISKSSTIDERAAKAEVRRQRNRMAAARSNVKRKIRNEKLRKDLAEIRKRAADLRDEEKVLRAENVRLRGLAAEKDIKVSMHLTHIQMSSLS